MLTLKLVLQEYYSVLGKKSRTQAHPLAQWLRLACPIRRSLAGLQKT